MIYYDFYEIYMKFTISLSILTMLIYSLLVEFIRKTERYVIFLMSIS